MKSFAAGFLTLVLLSGCAGFDQERHLAPLFSELSLAGGEREVEAFGGAVVLRKSPVDGKVRYWAVRPLISRTERSPEETYWSFLPPLGSHRSTPTDEVFQLLPITRFARQYHEGKPSTWSLLTLPGIYWAKTNDNRIVRAWFPFGGVVEHFLSMDRAVFFLFPLYTKIERHGRTTRHFLWPVFTYADGAGGKAWRVWPLIGNNSWEGRYDRWFLFWPFFSWQHNDISRAAERQQHSWMIWPLFGHSQRGASQSWTGLWPFFGYSTNPEKEFWAWDGPWPFVRFQDPGTSGQATRWRIWPLYSYYEGDDLTSRWIAWPFYNRRTERYTDATKDATNLFPIWHSWDRVDRGKGRSRWRKLFPLFRYYGAEEKNEEFFAFPTLNPLWRLQFIDEHFAWMWELYSNRRTDEVVQQRSWLGLWRREMDPNEDRKSLSGIWARRKYTRDGEAVKETSLLLGLLRWRTTSEGSSMLLPAFPGPGWPLDREVRTLPEQEDTP